MFENVKEIILKVTRDCNLRCKYCYIRDKDKYNGERMSFATFQSLLQRIIADKKRNIRDISPSQLSIVFHGGEPTLLGIAELTRFIDYANEVIPGTSFSIQTNLTNITSEWVHFFMTHKIVVGTSVDGVHWRDSLLRSQTSVINKLRILRKAKVSYGMLMVLNQENIRRFLKNALKLLQYCPEQEMVKANFVENIYSPETSYPEISVDELYKYVFLPVMKLFLQKNRMIETNVQTAVEAFVQNIVFEQETQSAWGCLDNCLSKFCGGGHTVVEVDPEGKVCFCGRWSDAIPLNTLGDYTKPGDFMGLESYRKILELQVEKTKDLRLKHCDLCFAADVCNYGCIAFSYEKYQEIKIRKDLICEYAKRVKIFMLDNLAQIIYAYTKSNNWEIKTDRLAYYLNVVPRGKSLKPKQLNDYGLSWQELEPGKIYLKVAKKTVHQRMKVRP